MNLVNHAERVAAASVALVNALTPGREHGHDVPRLNGDEVRAPTSAAFRARRRA